jgi:hypothetical protein
VRRGLSIALGVILAIAVVVTVVVSRGSGGSGSSKPAQEVRGVIGSEKQPFFDDPAVQKRFEQLGYHVDVDTAGSRAIATQTDLSKYDFAFPAGTPQAQKIKNDHKVARLYVPFSTPMAIATFDDIAKVLVRAGVATDHHGWYSFDVAKYLELVAQHARWKDLPGNTAYPVEKQMLITSTDVTTSNSSAMYASIAGYVLNGNNVVTGGARLDKIADPVAQLFICQGYQDTSSEGPFEDYVSSIGKGKTPMVMIYESQFLARAASHDGSITPDRVLMYPDPEIVSKHTFVPLTANGDAVGQLLTTDPQLQALATQYGFRTQQPRAFTDFVAREKLNVAPQLLDVIEPPSYEDLEALITAIDQRETGNVPCSTATTPTTPTTAAKGAP